MEEDKVADVRLLINAKQEVKPDRLIYKGCCG